jgi:hypothetical protein
MLHQGGDMNRRIFERIPVNLSAIFHAGNMTIPAVVTNISMNGMCIDSKSQYAINSSFEVVLSFEEEIRVLVKVIQLIKTGHVYHGMRVTILNEPKQYFKLVARLQSHYKVENISSPEPIKLLNRPIFNLIMHKLRLSE